MKILAGYNFESVNPAFLIFSGKVNREKFIFKIKEKIAQSPRKTLKLTQLGFHANGKDVCFCAGNRIILGLQIIIILLKNIYQRITGWILIGESV